MPHSLHKILPLIIAFLAIAQPPSLHADPVQFLLTADAEGHTGPCQTCPLHQGFGGLPRRATAINQLRSTGAPLLLLDAGNALFGDQSLDTAGKVIVAAYNALGYDAINISYRDFRLGKAATLQALADAKFPVISANLLDAQSANLLFEPFIIKQINGQKIAIIGLTESPAALAYLPSLKHQLAGIKIAPPADALNQYLPKARAESAAIILLYYGSPAGATAIHDQFAKDLTAILVGGARPDELPAASTPPFAAADMHGKSIANLKLSGSGPTAKSDLSQIEIDSTFQPDPAMVTLVAQFNPKIAPPPAPAPAPAQSQAPPPPPPAVIVPGSPMHVSQGLADYGITADQVNLAIDHGSAFLWSYLKDHDLKGNPNRFGDEPEHILSALALVHCDAQQRFPDFDQTLRAMLAKANPAVDGIYRAGILNMLIQGYGNQQFIPQLQQSTRFLLESQGTHGRFNYVGCTDQKLLQPQSPAENAVAWQRRGKPNDGYDGDNSVSQFAVLGLSTASQTGIHLPDQTWQAVLDAYRTAQQKDGGWSYTADGSSYGSMTCAGICSLAIARYELGKKDFANDPDIQRGLSWLDNHFSVSTNPEAGTWGYYYLYSLERTGRILQTDYLGNHQWYPEGASYLIHAQNPDGSWIGKSQEQDPRLATSFALLFLTRATAMLDVQQQQTGILKTFAIAPPRRLYIILDCSGSMIDMKQGRQKFQIARGAVAKLVASLKPGSQAALRVYGHRKGALDPGCDEDTELKIPMGPVDQKVFAKALSELHARGKTPLALSLQLAKQDIGNDKNPTEVLLLTDGGEDTMPRRDPIKAAAELAKLPNVTLDVIGFDIGDRDDWRHELLGIAKQANGGYWPADKIEDLDGEVTAAALKLPNDFAILDANQKEITRAKFGQTKILPPGQYILRTRFGQHNYDQPFTILQGQQTGITFDQSTIPRK